MNAENISAAFDSWNSVLTMVPELLRWPAQ
jgi:hypothetical protein